MGTITKTIAETNGNKSTWTFEVSLSNITASSTSISIPMPTIKGKYSAYAGKNGIQAEIDADIYINGVRRYTSAGYHADGYLSANTFKTFERKVTTPSSFAVSTSNLFSSSNPTNKTVNVAFYGQFQGASGDINDGNPWGYVQQTTKSNWGNVATITLNAPPAFTAPTLTKDTSTGYYAGATTVSASVSATAQYGGTISKVKLTIGSQSAERSDNGSVSLKLNNAGTFTPTVTVTDSRGQTTTKNLSEITVNAYSIPSVSAYNVFRTNSSGVRSDEGLNAIIKTKLSYTSGASTLTEPTVTVKDASGNSVTASVAWYSSYSDSNGITGATAITNWSNVSSDTYVYGLITATGGLNTGESYKVTIQETDSLGKASNPVTQTLSTAFYTIDVQAGGKEIVFGGSANDNVSGYPNGLFRCDMRTLLNQPVTVQGGTPPYYTVKSTQLDLTDSPPPQDTTIHDQTIRHYDSNGTRMGNMEVYRTSNDALALALNVGRIINDNWSYNTIAMRMYPDGTMDYTIQDPSAFREALNIRAYGQLVTLSSELSLTTTAKKVPLTTFAGVGCSLSSNGIKVDKTGVYVVSGSVYFTSGFTALDVVHAYLYKNSTVIFEGQVRLNVANYFATVPVGPVITNLSAGDVVYLYAMNQGGARGAVASRTGNGITLWQIG